MRRLYLVLPLSARTAAAALLFCVHGMTHFSDPETRQLLNERKTQRDNEWLLGQIGEAVLGYLEKDAQVELSLLRMEK
jgi:hypothetical protein